MKLYKPFGVWLAVRLLFPSGRFELHSEALGAISGLIKRKPRTIRKYIRYAQDLRWIRGQDANGFYYLTAYNRVLTRFGIKSASCFDFDVNDLVNDFPAMKEKFFSVNIEHLVKWRRHSWGWGNQSAREKKRQSYKKWDSLSVNTLEPHYSPEMLSARYLSKMFNLSVATVHDRKLKSRRKKLLAFRHNRKKIDCKDFRLIRGLRELHPLGRQITFEGGKYMLNQSDSFNFEKVKTKFYSRTNELKEKDKDAGMLNPISFVRKRAHNNNKGDSKMKKVKQAHGGAVNQFEKGESGNPQGRPRKYVSALAKDYGYKLSEITDCIQALVAMNYDELAEVINNATATALEATCAKALKDSIDTGKLGNLDSLMNRAYGKPKENVELSGEQIKIVRVGVDMDKI